MRTVCVFPTGHRLETCKVVTPADLDGERIIHTRRDSAFFKSLSDLFKSQGYQFNTLVEIRQFTAACALISQGIGVAVISELDAEKIASDAVQLRPFAPTLPHRLSLLQPTLMRPSLVVQEFIEAFEASLEPYRVTPSGG